jgi:hypothetical protein
LAHPNRAVAGGLIETRIARLVALLHREQRLIDEGRVKDQAEITRLVGLSRARVGQIMELRWLAPAIQHLFLDDEAAPAIRDRLGEREVRILATNPKWATQIRSSA